MHKILIPLLLTLTLLSAQSKGSNSLTQLDMEQAIQVNDFYKKNLQKTCGRTSANFAQTHTRKQWLTMKQGHAFLIELGNICPRSQEKIITIIEKGDKRKFEDFYRYALKYSKDSGLFPPS